MPSGLLTALIVLLAAAPPEATQEVSAEQAIWKYNELRGRPVQTMTNVDVAAYLEGRTSALRSFRLPFAPSEEMAELGRRTCGQSFRLNARRFDMSEGDCVTFVERTLALSLATDWRSYQLLSERLRHKDGVVGYKTRNFQTLGEWIPNNAWLLEDITGGLGDPPGSAAESFTYLVRPNRFEEFPAAAGSKYTRIVFRGPDDGIAPELRHKRYVPRERISHVLPQLRSGDVVILLRAVAEGHLECNHMGLISTTPEGAVEIIDCAPPRTRRQELSHFVRVYKSVAGLLFLRLRTDTNESLAKELPRVEASRPVPPPQDVDLQISALKR